MRQWEFGIFDAHAADFNGESFGGRSVLVWSDNTYNQEDTGPLYNEDALRIGNGGGSEPFHQQLLVDVALEQVKAKLGQIPVLLRVDWTFSFYGGSSAAGWIEVSRMYTGWDIGDTSNRYKDKSALITWYEDAYSPYPGQDRAVDYTDRVTTPILTALDTLSWNVTPIVARALRDNVSIKLWFHGYTGGAQSYFQVDFKPLTDSTRRPRMTFYYMYPIEFFESDGSNAPDYASTVQESEDGHYYLGAVERGATGSPTQGWVRNFTTTTQQVEIFDDHPEWVTPVQRAGTGTGELDYVTLAENATSQLYTVVFYSSTQYEVKAEAYRDNATGYHPQIDADGSWRSDVNSTWTSPSGGLTITAAMWQAAGISSGDEFEIGVRGNTTDEAWAADSNEQVEITFDDTGSPGTADNTEWRPILGHREKTTGAVDVDATSKFFPLRHLVPSDWTVGSPCFIHDAASYDAGTLTSVQERDLGTADATNVVGLDDLTESGNYNGNANNIYRVQITGTGTPNTFSWSNDGTTSWSETGVSITGTAQLLEAGVYVTFGATTGHTSGDYWLIDADTWGVTVGGLTAGAHSYNPGAVVAQTLPIRDLEPVAWSTINADSGTSQSPASRLYVADSTPFTEGDVLHVQQVSSGGTSEEVTIASGGVQADYLDLTSSMVNDYENGDFVTVKGTGERAFWARPVANTTTVEELKRLRFNARIL